MPVQSLGPESIRVALTVPHADGQSLAYAIIVRGNGNSLTAAEDATNGVLPRFCPDRHIEGEGVFCMYWEDEQRLDVIDDETASRWLEVLVTFLRNQRRATNLGRWPTSDWAHGATAAVAQRRAEQVGGVISEAWRDWVRERRMVVERTPNGVLRVNLDGDFLYSTWLVPRRRNGIRSNALRVCEADKKSRRIVSKRSRAVHLRELAVALAAWQIAEEQFWKFVAHRPCCGTMETCGLRKNA